jgi:predicted nucleic acid-binding protein
VDRVFLDANVLFSAAYRQGAGVCRLWDLQRAELITSEYAAEEARCNLVEEAQRQRLSKLLRNVRIVPSVAGIPLPSGIVLPEKDRPILMAAIQARATHLLTGDKLHFGKYFARRIAGVLIMLPGVYLALP